MIAAPSARIVSERLFDVDVFAGVAGVDGHRYVPMVGAGDQDRIDILAIEDLAIVLGGHRLWNPPARFPRSRWAS